MDRTLPITVLTGYLGAGKTTLRSQILSQPHGRNIALITNELAEACVDHQPLAGTDAELIEVNGGCICCSARSDLIGAITRILESGKPVDQILIETTGLAAPAPVIQALVADDQIRRRTRLDAILTVVDLRHIVSHWHTSEAVEQIMFGDVLVLNKTDLVGEAELFAVRDRIRRMNPLAKLHVTQHCELPLEAVLNLQAFDLSRALAIDGRLLETTDHTHDGEVGAICLTRPGVVDREQLERFLFELGQSRGSDLYRLKGILNVDDERRRFLLQGVHMWFESRQGLAWQPNEPRINQLVFIGRGLDRAQLERGFAGCFSATAAAVA